MNLDELQSVQARERQSSDLQHLRASFYREVGEFIQGLTQERADAVAAAEDPFSDPDVRRLSDDIETAEQTVEAIYERRVGKVVKKASIAAAGMPVDVDGLTDEEAALFDDLVERIERNRESVLATLGGEGAQVSPALEERPPGTGADAPADAASESDAEASAGSAVDGVSAADIMGEDPPDGATAESADTPTETPPPGPDEPPAPDPGETGSTEGAPAPPTGDDAAAAGDTDANEGIPGIPRTTVRITADVGQIVGADDRDYDLSAEDVVTLPASNADVLVDKDAAERLAEE